MSRLLNLVIGSVVISACTSGLAVAQQQCNTAECREDRVHAQNFWRDYYRNKLWPRPFRANDTQSVLSYFEVQRNNGWKLNNTLGTAMFDQSCALTPSGLAHLQWIVARAPQDRRVVFVLQGKDAETTSKRVETTQIAISRLIPTGTLPAIYLTDRDAPGSSGEYQTAIARAISTSAPAPRLPANAAAASSGSTP